MKKFIIFSSVIALSLILLTPVLAKDFSLPDISLTPDNPFYFLKSWKESIQTFFTFGLENKAKQYLHLAGVRLAEYQKMMEIGKIEIAGKTLNKYQDQLNRALEKANELKQQGKDIKDLTQGISQIIPQSLEILQNNLQKVPEQARKGIENAIENSKKVIGNILGNQTEKACTQEAKICPDGTAVGRSGPNCEFGPCPIAKDETTSWKTYQNKEYGFEVKYPKEWKQNENQDNVEFLSPQDIEARKNSDSHFHTFSMNISVEALGKNEIFEILMQKRFGMKN